MAFQCNIDAKGKLIRLIYGVAFVSAGLGMMIFWARPSGSALAWFIASLSLLGGAFAIFESRKGWCAVRAMGFKTSM